MKKFDIYELKSDKLDRLKGGDIGGPKTYTTLTYTHQSRRDKDSVAEADVAPGSRLETGG